MLFFKYGTPWANAANALTAAALITALQVDSIVDEPNVGLWVRCLWTLVGQEVDDLCLDMWMFAIFDVFGQYKKGVFSLRWADNHYRVYNCLPEFDVSILFKAICQEFQNSASLGWKSLVQDLG